MALVRGRWEEGESGEKPHNARSRMREGGVVSRWPLDADEFEMAETPP